jgi:hypothetical protein
MFFQILKRTSHIVAVVDTVEKAEPRRRAVATTTASKPAPAKGRAAKATATEVEAKPKGKAKPETGESADKGATKAEKPAKAAVEETSTGKEA